MKVVARCLVNVNEYNNGANSSNSIIGSNFRKIEAIGVVAKFFGLKLEIWWQEW
jgi:hypothetical protein